MSDRSPTTAVCRGPYTVLAPLGQGGMGSVVRARDDAGVEVALKHAARDRPSHHAALAREADHLSSLDDPGVVRFIARGTDDQGMWLAVELLSGQVMSVWWTDRPVDEVVAAFAQLADTLARVHAAGVVHGDLKPANVVMVDGRGPVLVDFGLASTRAAFVERLRGPTVGGGTPSWWAPEQTMGDADARSDLFSLGRMLAEAVPPDARPAALQSLVDDLLQAHPDHRPAHAVQVSRRLHALAGTRPPPHPAPRPHPPRSTGREAVVRAAVGLLEAGGMVVLEGFRGVGTTHVLQRVEAMAPAGVAVWTEGAALHHVLGVTGRGSDAPAPLEGLRAALQARGPTWLLVDRRTGPPQGVGRQLLESLATRPLPGVAVAVVHTPSDPPVQGAHAVRVPGLDPVEMGHMVVDALGTGMASEAVDAWVDAAAGRPGWLARALSNADVRGPGQSRATGAAFRRRLEHEDNDHKGGLARCARVGDRLPRGLVGALGVSPEQLDALARRGWWLYESHDVVRFSTPRARDVAAASPLGSEEAGVHHRIAMWLDQHAAHQLEARARHHAAAGAPSTAARLWEEAAEEALARADLGAAERCLEAWIAVLPSPVSPSALVARMRLANKVLRIRGRSEEAEARLQAVVDDATTQGHLEQRGAALRRLGYLQAHRGELARGANTLNAAREASLAAGDVREAAYALADLGATQRGGGDWPAAAAALRQAITELDATVDARTAPRVRRNIAIYRCSLGGVLNIMGDLEAARHTLARGLDTLRQTASPADLAPALAQMARLLRRVDDLDGSVTHSREAIRMAEAAGEPQRVAQGRVQLAETWMALGRLAEADQELAAARDLLDGLGFKASEVYIWGRSGDLYWQKDQPEQALAFYTHALDCCAAAGLGADGAVCRIRIASCARRLGDQPTVARQLGAVRALMDRQALPLSTRLELWCEEGLTNPAVAMERLEQAEDAADRLGALEPHAEDLLWTLRDRVEQACMGESAPASGP